MEEEEEGEEEEEERKQEQLSNTDVSRASSGAVLLSEPRGLSEGLVNPAFSQDDSLPCSRSRPVRPVKSPRWACLFRDRPYGHCRSLSSSVENMTFSGAPLSPMRGSFPSLNDPVNKEILCGGRIFRDDTSLRCSQSRGIVVMFNTGVRKHNSSIYCKLMV